MMMMGIGMPMSQSRIERIVFSSKLLLELGNEEFVPASRLVLQQRQVGRESSYADGAVNDHQL